MRHGHLQHSAARSSKANRVPDPADGFGCDSARSPPAGDQPGGLAKTAARPHRTGYEPPTIAIHCERRANSCALPQRGFAPRFRKAQRAARAWGARGCLESGPTVADRVMVRSHYGALSRVASRDIVRRPSGSAMSDACRGRSCDRAARPSPCSPGRAGPGASGTPGTRTARYGGTADSRGCASPDSPFGPLREAAEAAVR